MKKYRFLIPAAAMALALICGTLPSGVLRTTAAQKPIPPECVDSCRQLLYDCIAQSEKDQRCIAMYRSCIARCK